MADHKYQMPDGSYPIDRCTGHNSVASAAKLAHNSDTYSFEEIKAHVMKAKNGLGCDDDVLPDSWKKGQNAAPTGGLERRYFPLGQVQVERRSGAPSKISGHSAVFNSPSEDLGFFTEIIMPGCFRDSIKKDSVVALFNHDPNYPLGSTYDGRLHLKEDDKGLFMEVRPTDTSYSRDLMTNIAEGLVKSQSFGFMTIDDNWRTEDGKQVRELHKVQLFDVSPVTFPAYPTTDVQVRQLCKQADLDFEGLAAAMVKRFRGLDLSRADRDILSRASNRLPILRGSEGQAPPAPETKEETPQAWRLQLHRRRFALAAKSNLRAMPADPDDDAGTLAQSVDQALDEALEEHAKGNDDQAWQLVVAAETTVDRLLAVLGVPDSDETETDADAG